MKKIIFSAALLLVAAYGTAQDKLVRQAQTALEEVQGEKDAAKVDKKLTEAETAVDQAMNSELTKDKSAAYLVKAKIEDKRFQMELLKAANKQPFDTLAFYNHLDRCITCYDKADQLERTAPKFKEPSKIRPLSQLTIERYRNYYVNCGSLFSGNGNNKMAYDAFDKWLNVPKLSIFNGKDAFANDTTFDKSMIAYYACLSGYQAKDYAKALAHFDEASNYKKEQDQVYLLKAQVLNEQKDTVKWAEFMRETALKFPDHPSFAQNMLAYYQIKNRTEDALKFADELIAKDPSNKVAYSAKGVALFGQQKFLDAAEFFKKAAELDPTYADAWLNAGLCYYNAAGDATIKLPKNFRSTAYAQGAVKVKDLYRKAEPFFIHYRELKPDDTASWAHRLRFIYQTTDQPEKVKEMDKIIKDNQ